jgi:hypothetical protein
MIPRKDSLFQFAIVGVTPFPSLTSLSHLEKKFKYRLGEQAGMIHLFNFDGLLVQPSEQK